MDKEKPALSNTGQAPPGTYGHTPPPSYEQSAIPGFGSTAPAAYGQIHPPNGGESQLQVIVQQAPPLVLGPEPARVTCPSCREKVTTALEFETTTKTHLIAVLLLIAFFPLTCLPYCTNSCKSKNHYCTNCGAYLGRYDN